MRIDDQGYFLPFEGCFRQSDIAMDSESVAALEFDGAHLGHIFLLELRHQVIEEGKLLGARIELVVGAV